MSSSLQSILILFFLADMGIMLVVGCRLLIAGARNRRAPEAAIGTSAAAGAVGVMLSLVATTLLHCDPSFFPMWAASRVFAALGVAGLAIGNWRIYRPDRTWAAAAAAGLCAVAFAACAIRTLPGTIAPPGNRSLGLILTHVASVTGFGWGSFEAFRYHLQLRRRIRLGLADPMVAQRFWLWGVSGSCALGSTITGVVFTYLLQRSLASTVVPFVAVQISLFAAAMGLWFAFYPPAFYRRRIERSAAA